MRVPGGLSWETWFGVKRGDIFKSWGQVAAALRLKRESLQTLRLSCELDADGGMILDIEVVSGTPASSPASAAKQQQTWQESEGQHQLPAPAYQRQPQQSQEKPHGMQQPKLLQSDVQEPQTDDQRRHFQQQQQQEEKQHELTGQAQADVAVQDTTNIAAAADATAKQAQRLAKAATDFSDTQALLAELTRTARAVRVESAARVRQINQLWDDERPRDHHASDAAD